MFPVSTKDAGQAMCMPDVCKTPSPAGPVPIPYPNIAMMKSASKPAEKVLVCGAPPLTKTSEVPNTSGDNAGVNGGMVSNKFMQKCLYTGSARKVMFGGKNVVRNLDPVKSNNGNAFGAQTVPSQFKVTAT
jgi:hypothetical protein